MDHLAIRPVLASGPTWELRSALEPLSPGHYSLNP
jgi:hypothetical protein